MIKQFENKLLEYASKNMNPTNVIISQIKISELFDKTGKKEPDEILDPFSNFMMPEETSKSQKYSWHSSDVIGQGHQYEAWVALEIEKILKKRNFKQPILVNVKSTKPDFIEFMKQGILTCLDFWSQFFKDLDKVKENTNCKNFFGKFEEFEMDLLITLDKNERLSSKDFINEQDSLQEQAEKLDEFTFEGPCRIIIEITKNITITFEKFLQLEKDILYLQKKYTNPGKIYGIIITNENFSQGLTHFDIAKKNFLGTSKNPKPQIFSLVDKNEIIYLYKKFVILVEKILEQDQKIVEQDQKIQRYDEKFNEQDQKIAKLQKIIEHESYIEHKFVW